MSEREEKLYIITWSLIAGLMLCLSLSFYANLWWPTLGSVTSLAIVMAYMSLPLYILDHFKQDRRGFNLYAHRMEALLDFLPGPLGRKERSWPDITAIKQELSFFFYISLAVLVPYCLGFYIFMWLRAWYYGAELSIVFNWPPHIFQIMLTQIFVIALPEEFFWRGFVQSTLLKRWPNNFFVGALPLGRALIITNLLFALGHFVLGFNPARLLTFFPGMVFSWLVWRNKSLLSAILFHALSNILGIFLYSNLILR